MLQSFSTACQPTPPHCRNGGRHTPDHGRPGRCNRRPHIGRMPEFVTMLTKQTVREQATRTPITLPTE